MPKPLFELKQSEVEAKSVRGAVDFFEKIGDWIYSTVLRFIEESAGQKLYVTDDDFLPKASFKTKKLVADLIKKKIIQSIGKVPRAHHDEPEIVRYEVKLSNFLAQTDGRGGTAVNGSGGDPDEETAILKAIGEGLERLSLYTYKNKDLISAPFAKVAKKALNPLSFAGISENQRRSDKRLGINSDSCFRWVKGFSLFDKKETLIPAQLVYIGYQYGSNEPIIQQQISTGAAAANSLEEAMYRGICEAVERDAFVITYFNKLSPPLINLETVVDTDFQKLLAMFKRYNLEIHAINTTTDLAMPSILAVIIDRTGVGPAVYVGNKTDLNIKKAVIGAVHECLKGRISHRGALFSRSPLKEKMEKLKNNYLPVETFDDRFLYWASVDMIHKIDFLFRGTKQDLNESDLNRYQGISISEKLKAALDLLKNRGVDIYGVDITLPQIKKEGIWVSKVVSPQLQPFFSMEGLKQLSGERLFNVPIILGYRTHPITERELNSVPHPFL